MTTAELIKRLQEEDPSGELQVVVDNVPIYTVDNVEAYWDGRLQMLVQDRSRDPFYNIVGYKVTERGRKVRLHTMDLDDVVLNDPDIPVDLSELSEHYRPHWERTVRETREETKRIIAEVDAGIANKKEE